MDESKAQRICTDISMNMNIVIRISHETLLTIVERFKGLMNMLEKQTNR